MEAEVHDVEPAAVPPEPSVWLKLLVDVIGTAVVALVTAVVVGRAVALIRWMLRWPTDADTWWATVPAGGALLAIGIVHAARTQAATADAYVHGLHHDAYPLRPAPPRFLALLVGVGSGVPLGYEGPMVFFGGAVGAALARWWQVRMRWTVLAGGAAAVSMVIGTPLGGAIFASEVARRGLPDRRDLFPVALGGLAAAAVLVLTGSPLGVLGAPTDASWGDVLLPGLVIGAVCGTVARGFVAAIRRAKSMEIPLVRRSLVVAMVLLVATTIGWLVTDQGIFLGSGERLRLWAATASVPAVLAATLVFAALVVALVGGGVVGGLFLPLVSLGALVGGVVERAWLPSAPLAVATAVGAASMLAAGYGTPLTAAALLLATTGWSSTTAVGLGAIVIASAIAGERSVSIFQVSRASLRFRTHVRS